MIGGGDGKYTDVAILLRQIGKRVVVLGVSGSVHANLLAAADKFVEIPFIDNSSLEVKAPESVTCAAA